MARVPVLRMLVTPINSLAKDLGLLWNDVIIPNFSRKPKLKRKLDRHFLKHSYLHVNILYDIQTPYLLYKPMVLNLESQSDHLPKRLPRPLSSCTEPWFFLVALHAWKQGQIVKLCICVMKYWKLMQFVYLILLHQNYFQRVLWLSFYCMWNTLSVTQPVLLLLDRQLFLFQHLAITFANG